MSFWDVIFGSKNDDQDPLARVLTSKNLRKLDRRFVYKGREVSGQGGSERIVHTIEIDEFPISIFLEHDASRDRGYPEGKWMIIFLSVVEVKGISNADVRELNAMLDTPAQLHLLDNDELAFIIYSPHPREIKYYRDLEILSEIEHGCREIYSVYYKVQEALKSGIVRSNSRDLWKIMKPVMEAAIEWAPVIARMLVR